MEESGLPEQVVILHDALQAIETRLTNGEVPPERLQDFKAAIDDLRLRVWGLLSAGSAEDATAFLERFRIRRAKDMCRAIAADLGRGALGAEPGELSELEAAADHLARTIAEAQRQRR